MDTCASVESAAIWAQEEFGGADLGDLRRTKRLVTMGGAVAQFPSGRLTDVFLDGASLQGAYKFLENEAIEVDAIIDAIGSATAKRCAALPFIFVAVDGTCYRSR